jgi:hypothetical protein
VEKEYIKMVDEGGEIKIKYAMVEEGWKIK